MSTPKEDEPTRSKLYAGDGAAIAFCVLELISITENGTKMGVTNTRVH
ncbi:hypothetical protein ACMGD3_13875 [Lysinibacillus sphaericus]